MRRENRYYVIDAEIDIIKELGVEIKCGVEVGKDVTIAELKEQGYKAFYIAIGCQGGRFPGVDGEDADGIQIAVDFLHSATENQNQKMNGKVVVIGGGNVAVDCARTAHRFGANEVSMVCLESAKHSKKILQSAILGVLKKLLRTKITR